MDDRLIITFWDVQHGNATHIRTPNDRTIVIDLGDADSALGSSARFSPLKFLRYNQGVRTIDRLIITHPHRDHLDDIDNLGEFSVNSLLSPNWLTETEVRQGNRQEDAAKISQYIEFSKDFNLPITRPNDTEIPEDWGGVRFKSFFSSTVPRSNLNNHSIVTFAAYAGSKALISGDNEAPSWRALLEQPSFVAELPGVDVLLAPHHGREAGYCQDLFNAGLNPYITVISDDQHGSTSVTGKYHAQTRGWPAERKDGTLEERFCVTTRCDGTIVVTFGKESPKNYLNVKI